MTEEISADELKEMIDRDQSFYLVDNRDEDVFSQWHIKNAINYPFSNDDKLRKEDIEELKSKFGVQEEDKVVAVCAKGVSSFNFAEELERFGYERTFVLDGGMNEWSRVYDVVPIITKSSDITILQIQRRAKGCLGYIVGSRRSGEAVIVDPSQHIDKYVETARENGFKIVHVFDTHIHADHISGGSKLADRLNVPYSLGSKASNRSVNFSYKSAKHNQVFRYGGIRMKAIHTPGHTSEMTSYLINEEGVITGDMLFVESIGRTELEFEADLAKEGAGMQYDSIVNKIMTLPDSFKILPSHFSLTEEGEAIDVNPGMPMFTTIGYLREKNEALRMDRGEFIEYMFENIPSKPPNYDRIIEINLGKGESPDEKEKIKLELGPNRCATSQESMVKK